MTERCINCGRFVHKGEIICFMCQTDDEANAKLQKLIKESREWKPASQPKEAV